MRMWLEFQKTDTVRHLGLLDLQRTMQRCLRRTVLPLSYSKGFNPHIQMSFASALSSGMPGEKEILDVALEGEVTSELAMAEMKKVLPSALPPMRVRMVDDRFPKAAALVEAADYRVFLYACADQLFSALPGFLAQDRIEVLKKTKSGEKLTDIRPLIYRAEPEDGELAVRVAFREGAALRPDLLMQALCQYAGTETGVLCRRTELLTEQSGSFVPVFTYEP